MALVLCLHPHSPRTALACGLAPAQGDLFICLEDGVLADPPQGARLSAPDRDARGGPADPPGLQDEELLDLIFEHPFTFIC